MVLELANMIHGEGSKNSETRHDDEPEGVAVLGFGCFKHTSRQGKRNSGTVVLKGVDDSGGKASHFLAPNINRGGGADDGVGGVSSKGDQDKNGAAKKDSSRRRPHMAEQKDGSGD